MEDYNFLADLLSTFRSLNDWIKALIILGFYATASSMTYAMKSVPRDKKLLKSAKPRFVLQSYADGKSEAAPLIEAGLKFDGDNEDKQSKQTVFSNERRNF